MKKFLLKASMALSCLFMAATAGAVETYLSTEGWIITPCSEIDEQNGSGYAVKMIDGDINTYWHSNWSNDTSESNYHFFTIDLGQANDIDGFDYWRRQNNTNGEFYTGKVYVSNEPFSVADHNAVKTFCDNDANTANGTFSFSYGTDTDPNGVRRCAFTETANGRYVLVVITDSGANNVGKHACCGEFKLYADVEGITAEDLWTQTLNADKVALAEKMQLLKSLIDNAEMPSAAMPEDLTVENAANKAAEVNTAISNYLNQFNGKQITIASTRRTNKPYLTAIPTGAGVKMNTQAEITPDAVWDIVMQDAGFKLYSRTTGNYITNGTGVYFPAENGTGIALAFGDGKYGLNVDGASNDLTTWGAGYDGSRWNIALAAYSYPDPEVSTAEAPKYYRIVSARWMNSKASPCFAVNGENQAGSGVGEQVSRAKAAIPGIYWRVESVGEDGGVKLVNLTGYELTYSGQNAVTMAEAGSTIYLHKQSGGQFAGLEGGYAIASSNEVSKEYPNTGGNCLDADPNGSSKICWNPSRENRGHGDNGSLWYFILASESEVANATAAYIEAVKSVFADPLEDESLRAFLGEDVYNDLYANMLEVMPEVDMTTIAGINAAKYADYTAATTSVQSAVMAKFAESVKDQIFMVRNRNTSYTNCFMTKGVFEDYDAVTPAESASNLAALWAFDVQDGDTIKLRNVQSGLYVDIKEEKNKAQPLTEAGFEYVVNYNPQVPGFNFVAKGKDSINGIHQSDNEKLCRWYTKNGNNGIPGSHWEIIALEECPVDLQLSSASGHVMTFGGMTVNAHESAADLRITVTKRPAETEGDEVAPASLEPDTEGVYTISAADIEGGEVSLSGLSEGIYDVVVPAGMFVDSNGMILGAYSDSFSVSADGTTTGIEEVVVAAPVQQGIYDLQGRKLSAPVKGINIINGKKVLVK